MSCSRGQCYNATEDAISNNLGSNDFHIFPNMFLYPWQCIYRKCFVILLQYLVVEAPRNHRFAKKLLQFETKSRLKHIFIHKKRIIRILNLYTFISTFTSYIHTLFFRKIIASLTITFLQ